MNFEQAISLGAWTRAFRHSRFDEGTLGDVYAETSMGRRFFEASRVID